VLSKVSSFPPRYAVGQIVEVLFDAVSGESRLCSWFEMHGAEAICFFLFVPTMLLGVYIIFAL
jgi:hypothetical protein